MKDPYPEEPREGKALPRSMTYQNITADRAGTSEAECGWSTGRGCAILVTTNDGDTPGCEPEDGLAAGYGKRALCGQSRCQAH
jgi:hypothetical protein